MSTDILRLLSGNDQEFSRGLVELGWYDYPPVLTDYPFTGKARAALNPQFRAAGEVRDTDAWAYRLDLPNGRWQDAVAVVESQLKQDPQFAVVFCNLPGALLLLVPSNPDKAFSRSKSGLSVDRIYLDLRQPSNFETETIKKLQDAPRKHFRARLQEMVNTERVTKKFYDRFKKELEGFQGLIDGISVDADRLWYSSVMLNRLMFIYFLQRKGFLDGDRDYLSNRLTMVQEWRGRDKFQSFYRSFLLRLFHEGLGSRDRQSDFEDLLGKVPYLNGGLFEVHDIESKYTGPDGKTLIDIPDDAFERVFTFFSDYEWCLDTRPSRTEKEINPDVLGYIFEKYINQKQMGAYYTKEDITEYISKNTIIPYLFDASEKKHKAAFAGDDSVWLLLQIEPDRYIYDALQKGVELELPEDIACGLDDVSKRDKWNTPAPEEYALPTEIWREVAARRKRYAEVRGKLLRGEVRSIDDLITLNLNIIRFAEDVIEVTDGPELIRAIWETMAGYVEEINRNKKAIPPMTVLDPTCGSGAFLFAALNILEPLYEGCLDRMQAFVAQADAAGETRKCTDFRSVLTRVNDTSRHPNREYFILKSIILNNLYGVDIMEEAVEICKLRLFLKMASVVEPDGSKDNYGLEPLPDMDFNIRAGNTLVGYATEEEIRGATADGKSKQLTMLPDGYSAEQMELIGNIDESPAFRRIKDKLAIADAAYELFRRRQVDNGDVTPEDKQALRTKLSELDAELNRYLAKQYSDAARDYEKWLASHQPFHWFVEFYGIMKRGGFEVIIGNPPWKEYSAVKKDYTVLNSPAEACGNLHGMCTARANQLRSLPGRLSFIVQLPFASSSRMTSLRRLVSKGSKRVYLSTYDDRPSRLFDGLEHCRCAIFLISGDAPTSQAQLLTTKYQRWYSEARQFMYGQLDYTPVSSVLINGVFPKYGSALEDSLLRKAQGLCMRRLKHFVQQKETNHFIFYQEAMQYWAKSTIGLPHYAKDGLVGVPPHGRYLYFADAATTSAAFALINTSLFYAYFIAYGDCFHLSDTLVSEFPVTEAILRDPEMAEIGLQLQNSLDAYSSKKTISTKDGAKISYAEFFGAKSKHIIDDIDRILSKHYGFSDEELDFIINYDIKYRMGRDSGESEE